MRSALRIGLLAVLVVSLLSLAPSARGQAAAWRVGLQAGHWRSHELPDELARLRTSTGASAGGYQEYQVNLDIAERTAVYLRAAGVAVDVLPATVPPGYRADAFVALHADGNSNTRLSGYKAATHWREWQASQALLEALRQDYGAASGLRWDAKHITSGMRGYYALSSGRYHHTIANDTPGVILELGFLTNAGDRQLMTQQADRLAQGIATGILRFLASKPAEGWPPPPPLPQFRGRTLTTANIRSGPSLDAPVVRRARRGQTFLVDYVQGSWARLTSYRSRGERWIHRDLLELVPLQEQPEDH